MASANASEVLAGIIVDSPERVLNDLAENIAALVGVAVSIEPLSNDPSTLAPIFGNQPVYLFPIEDQQGTAIPACVAIDLAGAAYAGGALIMMNAEAIKQALTTQSIPDTLHDSIGEVGNIIVGAASQLIGKESGSAADLRRGSAFRQINASAWPALLDDLDKSARWVVVAGKIKFEAEEKGTILVAASGAHARPEGAADSGANAAGRSASAEPGETAVAPPRGASGTLASELAPALRVQVAGFPADSAAVSLRETMEALGLIVLPMHAGLATQQPDVIFVVSRSHTDLKLRLGAINSSGRRPDVVIACSDRPTREIVLAARQNSADNFLVLPADIERLRELLASVAAPA